MPTNTVRIKSGECAILPSDAVIVSASTFGTNPFVTSDDCPELADLIDSKLEIPVQGRTRLMESNRRGTPTPNFNDVTIYGIRVNDVNYPFSNFTVSPGWPSVSELQTRIDSTGMKGLIKITASALRGDGVEEDKRGRQGRIELKTFDSQIKDMTFYGFGSSAVGSQDGGAAIEFRVEKV
jgi:hypothetical protein